MGFEHVHNVPNPTQMAVASPSTGVAFAATLSEATSQPLAQPQERLAPAAANSELAINVTGLRYAWIFNYPDGVTAGELHVPLGRPVVLNLSAQDVIHAFWVPAFRLKQDTIPGQDTQLRFTARALGDYPVICAELCGPYHGAMNTRVIVQTPEDYQAWLQEQIAAVDTQTLAATPETPSEFLAPYVQELGLEAEATAVHDSHHLVTGENVQKITAYLGSDPA